MEVHTGNILDYKPARLFDVIISNPPFYENELAAATNEKKLAHHSTELTFSELIPTVEKLLSVNGTFFMLIPFQRLQKTKMILNEHDLSIRKIVTVRPAEQHDPFRCMLMIDRQKIAERASIDIAIKSGQEYTNAFVSLLQPYYLHL
jgi:tRNA1Val (adenine37-N6)-methyltransferase